IGFQKRYIGRLGELLLNVWVNANEYPFRTLPVIMTEKVNWPKKIRAFLAAKLLGRRYSGSF
ncbi:MAG: exopolysaccharide biosynthesis protein, partial [Oscillospiraceae bacterium]|nr:exopolysaccharide biosynthesis protein [Oscillospiraceae bacterium]